MNMKNHKLFLSYCFIVFSYTFLVSQSFTHDFKIKKVNTDSLYIIPLLPEHKQYMSANLHDVRIFDSKNTEIPYVVLSEPLLKSKQSFMSYEIVSQTQYRDYSEIIIKNANRDKINNIAFNVNNSDAYKNCSVVGSNDMKEWFSVSASQQLQLVYNNSYTSQYKSIYFPLNDYLYFKLLIDDWYSHALKINSAGYFKNSIIAGTLNELAVNYSIHHDSKNKTSLVKFNQTNEQTIHQLDFIITSPRLYNRQAKIYVYKQQKVKRKIKPIKTVLYEFNFNSSDTLSFVIPPISEKEFFIEIENQDNPALQINQIKCKQLASYLICDLKKNEEYHLKSGNTALKIPQYDLVDFVNQIPQYLPQTSITLFKVIEPKPTIKKQNYFFQENTFIWISLGISALIILLFSRSLLKDLGHKNK